MAFFLCGDYVPGRILGNGTILNARGSTSWTDYTFTGTAYDPDKTVAANMWDTKFMHLDTNTGAWVVDYALPKVYLSGYTLRGVTSSGTAVYGGIRFLKNGTVIDGASCSGSSSDASPYFRRIQTSFAVGDVIKIQTKVSNTTQAYIQSAFTLTWDGQGYPRAS